MTTGRVRGGFNQYGFTVGILMLDTRFPRIPGDMGNAQTFPFPVRYQRVTGADPDLVVRRGAEGLLPAFVEGAQALEREGVGAITTNCGFLIKYQAQLARAVRVPVFTSSLLLVPLVHRMLPPGGRVGVMTVNAGTLTPDHLTSAGIGAEVPLAVVGMETEKEFTRALLDNELELDVDLAREEHVRVARRLVADHPDIGAIVLECTNMPPYTADIQRETGRPVRRLLGRGRACSVFSPPARCALTRPTYRAALSANRASSAARLGISIECFFLFPRLREVDEALTADPTLADRVTEVHPELSFRALAGAPIGLVEPKRSPRGLSRRLAPLDRKSTRLNSSHRTISD